MIDFLSQQTGLPPLELAGVMLVVLIAGLIRGFAGFALSAVVMASVTIFIPPVELIPVCFILEATASILMVKNGKANANMKIVWALVITSAIGVPIGLYATTSIDPETSKIVALAIIMALTGAQMFNFSPKFLATRTGLYFTGLVAGIVTGLSSVGGMVVALYVLASNAEPRIMRASLVMYLFISMVSSLVYLLAYGVMTPQAAIRGAILAPVVLTGVILGSLFFTPAYQRFYKRACLILLLILSLAGLLKQLI